MANNTANQTAAVGVDGEVPETVSYWRDRCREVEAERDRLAGKLDIIRSVVDAVA